MLFLVAVFFSLVSCGPCDIYDQAGTPCVCAHSTIRALFFGYRGFLYEVRRESDKRFHNVGLLNAGGYANAFEQDVFCNKTTCHVTTIYDQTGKGNHLTVGTPGGANPRGNTAANAAREPIIVAGHKAYALWMNPGEGYFHDGSKSGIPRGTEPGGIYMVADGTHVNSGCCFDYGNGEANRHDNGASHMNAIYFGTAEHKGGPWVMADLENGLFSGGSRNWNPRQRAFPEKFVAAFEKNDGAHRFSLRGGSTTDASLYTNYDGPLPGGYSPMKLEGGIILGTGGDDSSWSEGTFFEGAMVRGFPSDATEDAVHANIVAAGYGQ